MLEALGGDRLRHHSTLHENPAASIRERIRRGDTGGGPPADTGISREEQEALTLDHLARHYRGWVDEPVPALGDHTPREAARDEALRPRLIELIRGLEGLYEAALRRGDPAYDASWMWSEGRVVGLEAPIFLTCSFTLYSADRHRRFRDRDHAVGAKRR